MYRIYVNDNTAQTAQEGTDDALSLCVDYGYDLDRLVLEYLMEAFEDDEWDKQVITIVGIDEHEGEHAFLVPHDRVARHKGSFLLITQNGNQPEPYDVEYVHEDCTVMVHDVKYNMNGNVIK